MFNGGSNIFSKTQNTKAMIHRAWSLLYELAVNFPFVNVRDNFAAFVFTASLDLLCLDHSHKLHRSRFP